MGQGHDRPSGSPAAASEAAGVDPLSDVLRAVRLSGAVFFQVAAGDPWRVDLPAASLLAPLVPRGATHLVSYHLVIEGGCWLEMAGEPPVRLEAGDVLVLPHGDPYAMALAPGGVAEWSPALAVEWFREMLAGRLPALVREGGSGAPKLTLLCGFLACDLTPFNPLLIGLPRFLHVRRSADAEDRRLDHLIAFALAETRQRGAGSEGVLLRISELMFVEVVRRHLSQLAATPKSWLAGLRDPIVGRALALLHRCPERPWTLAELARQTAQSRSTLVERFTQFVGQPPIQYLTQWRMQLAGRLLADGATKVAAVAHAVGYESEAAFSRAFKKQVGVPPAVWRERHGPAAE